MGVQTARNNAHNLDQLWLDWHRHNINQMQLISFVKQCHSTVFYQHFVKVKLWRTWFMMTVLSYHLLVQWFPQEIYMRGSGHQPSIITKISTTQIKYTRTASISSETVGRSTIIKVNRFCRVYYGLKNVLIFWHSKPHVLISHVLMK